MVALCNVMLVQMRFPIVVTLGETRHGCFSQCIAGADVVQAQIEFVVTQWGNYEACLLAAM